MKNLTIPSILLLLLISYPPLQAEEYSTHMQPQKAPTEAAKQTKQYSSQPLTSAQRSRKCAIYSGVCRMGSKAKVGDYCICYTPSGPIHGVVIP